MNRPALSELLQKSNTRNAAVPLAVRLREAGRFETFSIAALGMLLDYSRVRVDAQAMEELHALARERGVETARAALFAGEAVNATEGRPALHMALRSREVLAGVSADEAERTAGAMRRMLALAAVLNEGALPAAPEQSIRDILHVGIGGSLLGPKLLRDAFPAAAADAPRVHFLGSVDAHERERLLGRLDPRTTAVVLVSKSFTTRDTLMHGDRIAGWMDAAIGETARAARTFAVTSNPNAAVARGVHPEQTLFLPEWVGGRYSVWSPVSLAAAAAIGVERFEGFLAGGAEMDRHFLEAPLEANLPVTAALLDVWHRNACGAEALGVIPYDARLALLPSFLQQLVMESNGKSVTVGGEPSPDGTSPIVFGEPGTDAQHSIFQALHQGTTVVPLDMIGVIRPDHADAEAHAELLANLLAQATALATGRSGDAVREAMAAAGAVREDLVPHRVMPGDRPTTLILLDRFDAPALGRLLAFYEHRVFVESVVWNINAFDQWGVELGKVLAADIQPVLAGRRAAPAEETGLGDLVAYIRERSG